MVGARRIKAVLILPMGVVCNTRFVIAGMPCRGRRVTDKPSALVNRFRRLTGQMPRWEEVPRNSLLYGKFMYYMAADDMLAGERRENTSAEFLLRKDFILGPVILFNSPINN